MTRKIVERQTAIPLLPIKNFKTISAIDRLHRAGLVVCAWSILVLLLNTLQADDKLGRRSTKPTMSVSQGDQLVLRFKTSPIISTQVVRLGDLVEVVSWGSRAKEELLAFPLGPGPQVGGYQDWTSKDLIRNLEYRGIDKSKVAWHGPDSVRLMRKLNSDAPVKTASAESKQLRPAFLNERLVAQAEANLIQATREYLWLETGEKTQWRIALEVPHELVNTLAQKRNILSLGGGEEPWVGKQRFVYGIMHEKEEIELTMTVEVALPTTVVVTRRAIRRDEVLDEGLLTYAALPERLEGEVDQYFDDMSELIGKQLRRAVSTGAPIPRTSVGEPNVISSGEIIEIESVAGSVVVKSAAKALGGGAVGELINIELIPSRKRLSATVAGPMLVRIVGGSTVRSSSPEPQADEVQSAPMKTARKSQAIGAIR